MLLVAKLVSTSITLGSGGSGGIFAPSLFMGSMLGGIVGHAVHTLYPAFTGAPGAYALVGMGAVVAATTHAPIQAILIVFEMTRDYRIILPLMTACVVSAFLAQRLSQESIYTMKLSRRGVSLRSGHDLAVLREIEVQSVMSSPVITVKVGDKLSDVIARMQRYRYNGFPVVDANGILKGLITLDHIRNTCPDRPRARLEVPVAQAMAQNVPTINPSDNLEEAFRKFARHRVDRLVVVEAGRVVGMLTLEDLVNAYDYHLLQGNQGHHQLAISHADKRA